MIKWLSFAFILACLVTLGNQAISQPPAVTNPTTEPLRTAGEQPVDVRHLKVEVKVDIPNRTVEGKATISFTAIRDLNLISLDAEALEVKRVSFSPKDGKSSPTPHSYDKHKLDVAFEPALKAQASGELVIEYRVRSPKKGLNFFSPSKSEPEVPLSVWSQGESVETRHWIPCFDRPGIRQSTEIIATVAEGNEVLSNGKLLSKKTDPATKTVTFHWRQDEPHPVYLISMVVGPFAVVEDRWRDRPVLYYVPPSRKDDARRTFGRTPEMMEVFSKKFGVDYAWNKYAQVVAEQFGGGMENTSATTLGDCILDERSAFDEDSDDLISHELGHQWWGDLVTCRDWAHLWLNEGFASYCECLWGEHRHGPDEYSIDIWNKGKGARSSPDRPVVDRRYPNPDSMFDNRAYPKGAFIVHMLRQRLGDEVFFAGLKKYLTDNRFKSVETVDLRRALEQVSGLDLEKFFYDWTERPGHPKLDISADYDATTKRVNVKVKQTQNGEPFAFPLAVRVMGHDSKVIVYEEKIDEKEKAFQIPCGSRPLGLEIDPKQAVLAEIKEQKPKDFWSWQIQNGSTAYSRIVAAEYLGKSKAIEDRESLVAALANEKFAGVAVQMINALAETRGDLAKQSLLAELKNKVSKRRKAAIYALDRYGIDEKIAVAIRELMLSGEPSVGVEEAAVAAYVKHRMPDTVPLISKWLSKDSNRDRLKTTAIHALSHTQDPSVGAILLPLTKSGQAFRIRTAAINSLATWAKSGKVSDEQLDKSIAALIENLSDESHRIRRTAVDSLANLGSLAKSAATKLDELAANDPSEAVSQAAKDAAKAVRASNTPPELKQIKEELDRLKKEQEELRKMFEKQEKKVKN